MDTLILLSDECSELAAKLRRASESGADLSVAQLQRAARELAGSLILFAGVEQEELLSVVIHSMARSLENAKTRVALLSRHAQACEAKIAELMLELEQTKRRAGSVLS
jgi:hypothetical protein